MQTVIKFLENNQYDWAINFNKHNGFMDAASCFGISKTTHEIEEFLIQKIKDNLKGEDFGRNSFTKIEDHIAFNYFLENSEQYNNALILLTSLRYFGIKLNRYTNSLSSWIAVKELLEAILNLNQDSKNNLMMFMSYDKQKTISDSIIFLKNKGFKISIQNGDIFWDDKEKKKFFVAIDCRFRKLGSSSIEIILNCMSIHYKPELGRYSLRKKPMVSTIDKPYEAHIPYGYLFNVGLANFKRTKSDRESKKWITEIFELTRHFFCLEQLQEFNKFYDFNHNHETILPALQRNILYDQFFSLDQISVKHIKCMIFGIFSNNKFLPESINLDIYLDILKWTPSNSLTQNPSQLIFNVNTLIQGLNYKYHKDEVLSALNRLSFKNDELNKNYLVPDEIEKRNYFERPFIFNGIDYIYINPILCNYGFYYSILKICKESGCEGELLGKMTEAFVEKQLNASGINFYANKEYSIREEIANALKIKSKKSECDFIIETESTIIFIELKSKTLTVKARKGDINEATLDIARSFLHALSQTGRHEYVLRRDNVIKFNDGTTLELKNRDIERVSLSLFDFYSLHDGPFIHEFLRNIINGENKFDAEKIYLEINKILHEIRNQYNTPEFLKIYSDPNSRFFNCRFFSVPQLLEVLSNSSDNESFNTELKRTRQISSGSKDSYFDYSSIRQIQMT